MKRKPDERMLPVAARWRDKAGIVHGSVRKVDKAGFSIGVPLHTLCGRMFVTKHWKGHKRFNTRDEVESMRLTDAQIFCVTCLAEER